MGQSCGQLEVLSSCLVPSLLEDVLLSRNRFELRTPRGWTGGCLSLHCAYHIFTLDLLARLLEGVEHIGDNIALLVCLHVVGCGAQWSRFRVRVLGLCLG